MPVDHANGRHLTGGGASANRRFGPFAFKDLEAEAGGLALVFEMDFVHLKKVYGLDNRPVYIMEKSSSSSSSSAAGSSPPPASKKS